MFWREVVCFPYVWRTCSLLSVKHNPLISNLIRQVIIKQ